MAMTTACTADACTTDACETANACTADACETTNACMQTMTNLWGDNEVAQVKATYPKNIF